MNTIDVEHLGRLKDWFTRLPGESGIRNGYEFLIRDTGLITCAYIKIPKGHPWYQEGEKSGLANVPEGDLPVNGGATFYEYFPEPEQEWSSGCWIGWDYGHANDIGKKLSRENVYWDIDRVIETLQREATNEV